MDYGLILDVETTGIDASKDAIIEIGLIAFSVNEAGRPQINTMYGALEDPGYPIPEEIVKLTGITTEAVQGQTIDWAMVRAMIEKSSMIVAHNASFDKSFIEARPELQGLTTHWACSMRHIDWEGKGFRTRALNYLAADHGFVNPFAHRALFDCATTFRVIEPHFPELVNRSYQQEFRVFATGAAFESKDKLRAARYRWDPTQRVWFKEVLEEELGREREFLKNEIYGQGRDLHKEELIG